MKPARYCCKNCGAESPVGIGYVVHDNGAELPSATADCDHPHLVHVLDLLDTPVAGLRAEVRQHYDWVDWRPVYRILKTVERRSISGEQWIYVTWVPEDGSKDMGNKDCGYGGREISIADDWKIEVQP